MSIEGVVTGQINAANAWATSAHAEAKAALSQLAAIDIPALMIGPIPYTPLVPVIPAPATAPEPAALDSPPEIPELEIIEAPDKPDIGEVSLPALLSITIPGSPSVEFPSISFEPPVYTINTPENWSFSVGDILITDDPMIQACMTRLKNNIQNGGTGLSPAVEDAIWNRDLERNEQTLMDSTDKATTMWAKKGFSLPDGFLAHSLSELQKEYMNKRLDRTREIAVKQAELEQSNIFKSLELAINLTSKLIDMLIKYEELILRSQEDTAKFANEYIDLQIKTYMALLDAYKAQAQVYEISIRASLAKVEVYKAQIEAEKIINEVNKLTVDIYTEQIKATIALVDRYRSEVEAMKVALEAEKIKIEANKLQLDAWAEKAKVGIAEFSAKVELFKAEAQQNVAIADLEGRLAESNLRADLNATELSIKAIEITSRGLQVQAQMQIEAAKGVAAAATTLAAGAMAGVSASAGMSYGESLALEPGD